MEDDLEDNEDHHSFFSHAPTMPEDDLILSEVAILTGGRDQHGRPIITLPAKYHGILESKVKASGMDTLLRYFVDITRVADRKRGFAFVTDLQFATLDFVLHLKSTLNSIQAEMMGVIGTCVLYVILPLNKKTCKDTLTHLALRQSKNKMNKHIVPPYFQSIAVKDEMELFNYIEKSHLTSELGGYLQYSHHDWVSFRQAVEPFFSDFEYVNARLPNTFQQLATLASISGGNNKKQLQQTYNQLQEAYYDIRTSLHLGPTLEQCEQLMKRFRCLNEDDVFTLLAQRPIFKETKDVVEGCYAILKDAKQKMDKEWKTSLSRITGAIKFIEFKTEVVKLVDWFKTKTEHELKQGPDIADSLSRAEMLWNHYKTGLLTKSQDKLAKSRALVREGETLAGNSHHASEIATLVKSLNQNAEDFQKNVQTHQEVLQSVYRFYQLYSRARRWYVKCIKFLPSDLNDLYTNIRSESHDYQALQLQWEEDIRRFLHKNPLLEKEELKNMKTIPDDIGSSSLKKKGRLLSYRCLILSSLLSHSKKTSPANISDILKWCTEIHSHSEDSASHQSEIPPSSDHLKRMSSNTSLDAPQESKRHRKPDRKRRSHSQNADLHDGTIQASNRSGDGLDSQYQAHYDVRNQSESDDPLIERLGQARSFYKQFSGAQGDKSDEIDYGRRNNQINRPNGIVYTTQSIQPRSYSANELANSDSFSSLQHATQKYGIYGDSDVDKETGVVIHVQGPPHGFPENSLPGYKNHEYSYTEDQQIQTDPSSVVVTNHGIRYGLVQQGPNQIQHDISSTAMHPGNAYAENAYFPAQHSSTDFQLALHTPQMSVRRNDPPSINYNTNNSNFAASQIPSNPLPQQTNYANDIGVSPRRTPMSFHGSLINIHESHVHVDDTSLAASGRSPNHFQVGNRSPISRHRSMVNLSQSPNGGETALNGFPDATSEKRFTKSEKLSGDLQQISSMIGPAETGKIGPSRHVFQDFDAIPNLKLDRTQTSPYQSILRKLNDEQSRNDARVKQLAAKSPALHSLNARHSGANHVLSRSEMDLRNAPENRTPTSPMQSSLTKSHHSETNLHQPVANAQNFAHEDALLTSQNARPRRDLSDEQTAYYGRLNSKSSPRRQKGFSASGQKNFDDALNSSVRTWSYAIPSPNANTATQLSDVIPSKARAMSPLTRLEMEVALETVDAKAAIRSEQCEEQLKRQSASNGIIDQSWPSTASHDHIFENDAISHTKTPVKDPAEKSLRRKSSKKSDKRGTTNGQSEFTEDKHAFDLSARLQERNVAKPESRKSQERVSFSQEDDILIAESRREGKDYRALKSPMSSLRSAALASDQKQPSYTPHRIASTDYEFGLATTLQQVPNSVADKTSSELGERHPHAMENGTSHEYVAGNPNERQYPFSTSEANSGGFGNRATSKNPEVNWRHEHLKDVGLIPNGECNKSDATKESSKSLKEFTPSLYEAKTVRGQENYGISPSMHHSTQNQVSTNHKLPTESHDQNWRRQQSDLGISPSMHHSRSNQVSTNHKLPTGSHDQDWRLQQLDLGISPSMHHSRSNQVSTNDKPSTGSHDKDWRHQHLLELGISPSMHHSTQNQVSTNHKLPTESHDQNWRRQHLMDPGISPSMHHSRSNQVSTNHKLPTEAHDQNWRRQHLLELGVSPSMHHSRSNQVSTNEELSTGSHDQNWRRQHLSELGISPSMHHSTPNHVLTNDKPSTESHDQNWRRQHLSELGISPSTHHSALNQVSTNEKLTTESHDQNWRQRMLHDGISPSMHQKPVSNSLVPSRDSIAPMTDELRGVIESGRSLIDTEGVHGTTDETSRKSVRFAQFSDSALDAEERAQNELAHRLHQVELDLQAEEDSLKYKDVLISEQEILDRQLQELDKIEESRRYYSPQEIGQHVVSGGAVHPTKGPNIQVSPHLHPETRAPSYSGSHQHVLHPTQEGALQSAHTSTTSNEAGFVRSVVQATKEGAVRPAYVATSPSNEGGSVRSVKATHEGDLQLARTTTSPSNEGGSLRSVKQAHESPLQQANAPTRSSNKAGSAPIHQAVLEGAVFPSRSKTKPRSPKTTETRSYIPESFAKEAVPNENTSQELKTRTSSDSLNSQRYSKPARDKMIVSDNEKGTIKDVLLESLPEYYRSRTQNHSHTKNVNSLLLSSQVDESNSVGSKADIETVDPVSISADSDVGHILEEGQSPQLNLNVKTASHKSGMKLRSSKHEPISSPSLVSSSDKHGHAETDHAVEVTSNQTERKTSLGQESPMPTHKQDTDRSSLKSPRDVQFHHDGQSNFTSPLPNHKPDIFESDDLTQESTMKSNSGFTPKTYQTLLNSSKYSTDVQFHHEERLNNKFDNTPRTEAQKISHTPADYIACALGMDYVRDKSCLTVQPFTSTASSQDDLSDQKDLKLEEVSHLDVKHREGELNVHQTSSDIENEIQRTGTTDSLQNAVSLTDSRFNTVSLGKTKDELSSMHTRPEEKPITKSVPDPRIVGNDQWRPRENVTDDGNKTREIAGQNSSSSLRSLSIRQWLNEKENEETISVTPYHVLTDINKSGLLRDELADSFNSLQTGTDKMLESANSEPSDEKMQFKTTPSISEHNLDEVSQPTQNEKSVLHISATEGINTNSSNRDANELTEQHSPSLKKENRFSLIPVAKVYSALKDGGYLDKTQHQDESSQNLDESGTISGRLATETEKTRPVLKRQDTFTKDLSLRREETFTNDPRPALTRKETFTIDTQDEPKSGNTPENVAEDHWMPPASENGNTRKAASTPLALVLDHMVKKGSEAKSVAGAKKRHDSSDEPYENSSTESSASPSTLILSRKPTTNLYSTKKYYINVRNGDSKTEVTGSKARGHEGSLLATYEGLTESDRKEHDDLDDGELEKMMLSKSQLAEIRNLEIENRHLAYEKKEFEAHLIRNIQMQQQSNASQEL